MITMGQPEKQQPQPDPAMMAIVAALRGNKPEAEQPEQQPEQQREVVESEGGDAE